MPPHANVHYYGTLKHGGRHLTFEQDPVCWFQLLTDSNVDDKAIELMFSLSQYDFAIANEVMHNFINVKYGSPGIENCSAWITSAVNKARRREGVPIDEDWPRDAGYQSVNDTWWAQDRDRRRSWDEHRDDNRKWEENRHDEKDEGRSWGSSSKDDSWSSWKW